MEDVEKESDFNIIRIILIGLPAVNSFCWIQGETVGSLALVLKLGPFMHKQYDDFKTAKHSTVFDLRSNYTQIYTKFTKNLSNVRTSEL